MFIGFEQVCPIANGRRFLQLLEKLSSGLDRSTTTDKAKHFANSQIHRYPDPAFRFFYRQSCRVHRPQWRSRPSSWVVWLVTAQQPEQASGILFCDAPREFCQWLWVLVLQDLAFEPVLWGRDPCLCEASERFVDKLGNGNVGPLDSYQRVCRLDAHSEDTAALDLQISEITSCVQTTQLVQRQI